MLACKETAGQDLKSDGLTLAMCIISSSAVYLEVACDGATEVVLTALVDVDVVWQRTKSDVELTVNLPSE